ncbi:hypothetical protein SAMN05216553_11789 [Lentzea fradiae]|uniref:Uncharacterized protein n=1 Tax=Lentzea fradiae TaxID=200378 RepID=A0A1G8ACK4_9PSEU|nr:hypothetical protein [Lentzea fradiae]SDH18070.1 hypothetical protein SAMN05216553_11789 [Lentzea fradiae]
MSEQGPTPPHRGSGDEPRAAGPAPDQTTTPLPAGEQPAASAAEAPPPPPAATPANAVPARPGRVRRFAGHRATGLVAAGLLGLVLGGGVVGAVAANRFDDRGPVRMYDRGERGPDRFDERGPFRDRGDRGDWGDRFER